MWWVCKTSGKGTGFRLPLWIRHGGLENTASRTRLCVLLPAPCWFVGLWEQTPSKSVSKYANFEFPLEERGGGKEERRNFPSVLCKQNFDKVEEEMGQVVSSKGKCLNYILTTSPPTLSFPVSFWFNCSRWFKITSRLKPSHVRLIESLSSLQPLVQFHWQSQCWLTLCSLSLLNTV